MTSPAELVDVIIIISCPFFSKITKNVTIDGKDYLNMAAMNFLNMIGDQDIEVFVLFFSVNLSFKKQISNY